MTAPPPDCDAQKKRLLAELLAARNGDRIVDVSKAIDATFFCDAPDKVRGAAPKIGRVFLTSAAEARRGNITAKLIFSGGRRTAAAALKGKSDLEKEDNAEAEENRWIRGVLIVSGAILPPPESVFLDPHGNGRVFSLGNPNLSVQLLVRVVGVPLPMFIPHGSAADSTTAKTRRPSAQAKYRQILLETELCFLQSLEACLMWLLRSRRYEGTEKFYTPWLQSELHAGHMCRGRKSHPSSSASFFTEEPATLSVPLYYLPMHVEDNANSRLADVIDVAAEFLDLILDAERSVVRETTALLQELVRLSGMMANSTEGDSDGTTKSDNSKKNVSELLYVLHRHAAALLESTRLGHAHLGTNHSGGNSNSTAVVTSILPTVCDDGEYGMPLSELFLDGSALGLAPASFLPDDGREGGVGDPSSSVGGGCGAPESSGQATLAGIEGNNVCAACAPPGVLIHCLKGVSRSPSVIMAYYLRKFCQEFYVLSRIPRHAEVADPSTATAEEDNEDMYIFSFRRLLQCLQEARPAVNPQLCFLAELRSMWARLSKELAKKEAK
ncbi:protein-tyrosine phosphatase [Trypanosoma conorhini]|uniref:Protein-tyrosine phosphatase n=1 Tax=Trypanosoma conorhini TaxID=83891 RepID=A0A422PE08_9TRYP|nr:protein-tyrosine phosphatase [Trypanosoma conorhini]RNF15946.1 protein-tyrosine phosphatase [Trypanosoma conorhini]